MPTIRNSSSISGFRQKRRNPLLEVHTHVIDRLAVVNGFISGVALYPQVFKVLQSGAYEDVSIVSFSIILLNSVIWALYAFHRGLISLFVASLLNSIAAVILLLAVSVF